MAKLTTQEKHLIAQARRCGIIGFTDGNLGKEAWRIPDVLNSLSPEEREEFLAALEWFIEFTEAMRSLN